MEVPKKGIKIIENINDFKKVYKNKQNIFLEEFIDGKEFTVLGFVFKSKFYIVSVSDKITTNYPPYLEIAHVLPTRFPNFIGEIKLIMQRIINLTGLELVDELRDLQAKATIKLIKKFIFDYPNNPSKLQEGESTFYKKRIGKDSELDINKSIVDQFDLLRVCDNERYPAYFIIEEKKYILKITKEPN
jgi:hypothetical protein